MGESPPPKQGVMGESPPPDGSDELSVIV